MMGLRRKKRWLATFGLVSMKNFCAPGNPASGRQEGARVRVEIGQEMVERRHWCR